MLVLSRKEGEKLHIGDDIVITVTAIKGGRVQIGVEAPRSKRILRGELKQTVDEFQGEPAIVSMEAAHTFLSASSVE